MQGNTWGGELECQVEVGASLGAGQRARNPVGSEPRPSAGMCKESPVAFSVDQRQPNKRLKLAARRMLYDDSFFSAPQLKRDPLGSTTSPND